MADISLSMALRGMDVKEVAGRPVFFSLSFYTSSGSVRFMARARTCGHVAGLRGNRMRNVQEYDHLGLPSGKPVMVSIDLLRTFDGMRVLH